jgi:chromosome segregation ATPase
MKRLTFLPIVLWAATGCGSKIIDRLDFANYQLDTLNQQLCDTNKKIDEANKKLDLSNKINKENGGKIDVTNKSLAEANAKLEEAKGELVGIKGETGKVNKNLEGLQTSLQTSLADLDKTGKSIETKIGKNGEIMQKGFDELIKRSPPPKP